MNTLRDDETADLRSTRAAPTYRVFHLSIFLQMPYYGCVVNARLFSNVDALGLASTIVFNSSLSASDSRPRTSQFSRLKFPAPNFTKHLSGGMVRCALLTFALCVYDISSFFHCSTACLNSWSKTISPYLRKRSEVTEEMVNKKR